jgi:perosamine synthetase
MAAALGLAQLARADELLAARLELVSWYRAAFAERAVEGLIELPEDEPDGSHAWHLFIIRLNLGALAIDRAAVMTGLAERGIGASVHFIPLHLHPYYRRRGWRAEDFPVATREYERVISLPLWPGMTRADVDRVADALAEILASTARRGAA